MDTTVQIVVIVAVVLVAALFLGKRLVVRWGGKSASTGHGREQVIRAEGDGSSADRVTMSSGSGGRQEVTARGGAKVADARIDSRPEGAQADGPDDPSADASG